MADIRNRELTLADCRFDWVHHGYDKAFEGKATFSDIDGVVHHEGHFLFVELKSLSPEQDIPVLPKGQRGLYEALANQPNTTCLFVAGDMKKSIPYYVEFIGQDRVLDLRKVDPLLAMRTLRVIFETWFLATKPLNNQLGEV